MSLVGAYTALSSTGAPGHVLWDEISYLRSYTEDFTDRHPGALPGQPYGTFTHTASSTAALSVSDTASLSATEDPVDRNEIATTDTARLSASDVSLLFNRIDATDTARLTAGETISVVISGVTLKTASDTASLSSSETSSVGVSVDVTDTATLTATDTSALVVLGETFEVTDTANLSADEAALLEIFAGIVEKSVTDTALLTVSDTADKTEVNRIRKITFDARIPRITFEVIN